MTAPASPAPGSRATHSGPPGFVLAMVVLAVVAQPAVGGWLAGAALLRSGRVTRLQLASGAVAVSGVALLTLGPSRVAGGLLATVQALGGIRLPSGPGWAVLGAVGGLFARGLEVAAVTLPAGVLAATVPPGPKPVVRPEWTAAARRRRLRAEARDRRRAERLAQSPRVAAYGQHIASRRREARRPSMLLFDEFGALAGGASSAVIAFRSPMPAELAALAGSERVAEGAWSFDTTEQEPGRVTVTERHRARLDQDKVRAARVGEARIIAGGRVEAVRILQTNIETNTRTQAQELVAGIARPRPAVATSGDPDPKRGPGGAADVREVPPPGLPHQGSPSASPDPSGRAAVRRRRPTAGGPREPARRPHTRGGGAKSRKAGAPAPGRTGRGPAPPGGQSHGAPAVSHDHRPSRPPPARSRPQPTGPPSPA